MYKAIFKEFVKNCVARERARDKKEEFENGRFLLDQDIAVLEAEFSKDGNTDEDNEKIYSQFMALDHDREKYISKVNLMNRTIQEYNNRITKDYRVLFFTLNAYMGHGEVCESLSEHLGGRWKVQRLRSWDGLDVGFAFVSDADPQFDDVRTVEVSYSEDKVLVENTDTLKVVYAELGGDVGMVENNWNWLKLYAFFTGGCYDNQLVKPYINFIERDREFVDFVVRTIDEQMDVQLVVDENES